MKQPVALAALVMLLVSGCGGTPEAAGHDPAPSSSQSPPSAAPSSTSPGSTGPAARPARGHDLAGTGYRLRLPRGWRDVTGRLKDSSGVDRAAGARQSVAGFASNFNVVVTAGGLRASQLGTVTGNIRDRMVHTAPTYAVLAPTTVDGAPAGHLAGLRSKVHDPYWLEQYVVIRDDHTYIVSFSFSPKVPRAERDRTTASVLASWRWL